MYWNKCTFEIKWCFVYKNLLYIRVWLGLEIIGLRFHYIILNIACRFYKSWQYLVECSFSQCSRIHFFLDVIAFILWLRDDFCQFWSQWMVDNIWISNGSPLAVAKKVHGSKFGKCAQSQCMSDWAGKTRGVWHVARWMADSSNFGTQTLNQVCVWRGGVQ